MPSVDLTTWRAEYEIRAVEEEQARARAEANRKLGRNL